MATGRRGAAAAIGWSIAFLALATVITGLFSIGAAGLAAGSPRGAVAWLRNASPASILLQGCAALLGAVAATWLVGFKAAGLDLPSVRWTHAGSRLHGLGWGFGIGALAAAAALTLAALTTSAGWASDAGGIGPYVASVGLTGIVLAPAALAEEVLFRGVPLVLLARAFGRGAALVAVSIVFALAHLGNPHVSGLGLGNIALAGVFLGLAFFAPGGLWTAFGAHVGWNVTLAGLDAPVSGFPFDIPMLDYRPGGPSWMTGGAFGPEGGLAATFALGLACLIVLRQLRKDQA